MRALRCGVGARTAVRVWCSVCAEGLRVSKCAWLLVRTAVRGWLACTAVQGLGWRALLVRVRVHVCVRDLARYQRWNGSGDCGLSS